MPTVILPTPMPFDFALTVGSLTHYRAVSGADTYEGGVYRRALRTGNRITPVAVRSADGGGIEVTVPDGTLAADTQEAVATVSRMLGLDASLAGFHAMLEGDPVLAGAVGSLHGLMPAQAETVFEALVHAVVGQQIGAHVARMIRDGLVATYGTPVQAGDRTLVAFPSPETLLEAGADGLRAQKLSVRKVEYIQDIALRTLEGAIGVTRLGALDDEAAIAELCQVRGIGRWTAEWVLLRSLERSDVIPTGDLALQKVVSRLYFDGAAVTDKQLAAFAAERWRPYRGLAAQYLFALMRRQRAADEAEKPGKPQEGV